MGLIAKKNCFCGLATDFACSTTETNLQYCYVLHVHCLAIILHRVGGNRKRQYYRGT